MDLPEREENEFESAKRSNAWYFSRGPPSTIDWEVLKSFVICPHCVIDMASDLAESSYSRGV